MSLAEYSNVWLKWSHAVRAFSKFDSPEEALPREFLRAVSAFSAKRVMWASDVTHEESGANWSQLLNFVLLNKGLSDHNKSWVLGKTARALYSW